MGLKQSRRKHSHFIKVIYVNSLVNNVVYAFVGKNMKSFPVFENIVRTFTFTLSDSTLRLRS